MADEANLEANVNGDMAEQGKGDEWTAASPSAVPNGTGSRTPRNDEGGAARGDETGEDVKKDEADKKADEGVYGAPDSYDYTGVKLPEGMELDNEILKEFEPLAREFNLSNESANKLMGLAVKLTEKNSSDFKSLLEKANEERKASYVKLLQEDKELNIGDDIKYGEYLNTAKLGLKAFASEEFINYLSQEGLDYHPEFIKTFYKIGKLTQSERMPGASLPVPKEETIAQILYGSKG